MRPPREADSGYPRAGLHGQIVHEIGRQILSGKIPPGELLPAQMARPASRTALREAIKVLAAKGLVESRPRMGTRVRPRGAWNLLDPDVLAWQQEGGPPAAFLRKLTELRQVVEPAAAELAARRAGASHLARIEAAYHDMEAALVNPADHDAFDEADMRFHLAILAGCRNDLLEQMSHVVYSALIVSFRATSRRAGNARASLPRHRAILEAIQRRDGRWANEAMRSLVHNTAREIESLPRRPRSRAGR
jgi:GntR family transcriptional regulator, galactonate operon transcriptional repressor